MTASNPRVSQASQEWMVWERTSRTTVSTLEGYLIRAQGVGDAWIYFAYGPETKLVKVKDSLFFEERLFFEELEYKVRYEIGEEIPPAYNARTMTARRTIGAFRSNQCGGTDAALFQAKKACEQHRSRSRVLPTPPPCAATSPRGSASDRAGGLPNTEHGKETVHG